MVKPEWGTKRACPKCGTRFYDLGKEDPVGCITCGAIWEPEPVLKSKQPMPFEDPKKAVEPEKENADLADDADLDIDEDAETNPDDEVDIVDGDDIQLDTGDADKGEDH
ncbi:MAG: TIGR02300 family protein [Sphingomonadaceae bacterium]|nr:TIGR02300 family protein [Sphingomonadaceae bacterium]